MTALRVLLITPKLHDRFWAKVDKDGPEQPHMTTPCWLWTATTQGRYGVIQVKLTDGRFVSELAHRVAWALTNGALPDGFICHACDEPRCVRPTHLWRGTAADNSRDMVEKGRAAVGDKNGARTQPDRRSRGEDHYETDLTEEKVVEIRRLHAAGVSLGDLGARFGGLTRQAIWRIVHRKTWKHVI